MSTGVKYLSSSLLRENSCILLTISAPSFAAFSIISRLQFNSSISFLFSLLFRSVTQYDLGFPGLLHVKHRLNKTQRIKMHVPTQKTEGIQLKINFFRLEQLFDPKPVDTETERKSKVYSAYVDRTVKGP